MCFVGLGTSNISPKSNKQAKLECRFKKNLNRAGTTLMQKTGQIERTVDREFADEEAKYKA